MYVYMYVCMYRMYRMYVCMYRMYRMYVCMYVCMYVYCMYVCMIVLYRTLPYRKCNCIVLYCSVV